MKAPIIFLILFWFSSARRLSVQEIDYAKDYLARKIEEKFFKNKENTRFLSDESTPSAGIGCKMCVYSFVVVQKLLNTRITEYVLSLIVDLLCRYEFPKDVCAQTQKYFGDEFISGVIARNTNPGFVCYSLKACSDSEFYTELKADDFARRVLADKPNRTEPNITNRNETSLIKFVHLTDVHIDLNYKQGSNGLCEDIQICCRADSGTPVNESAVAGHWGFLGQCDIPIQTLNASLDFIKVNETPSFVIWTGDNPSHEFMSMQPEEGLTATLIVTSIIKERLKGIRVYPTLGNHEKVPLDQMDVDHMDKEYDFLKRIGDSWRDWIGDEAYNTFIKFGYYTTMHFNTSLRIISLNTFLWDTFNLYLVNNPTNPLNQMDFLEEQLRYSEAHNQTVFIIGHIPPGSNYFSSEASRRYNALIDRFYNIIQGQFYGHTHSDEFKIIREYYNKDNIAGVVQVGGSLTTHAYRHPGYRVYSMYKEDFLVKDFDLKFLNITKANLDPTAPIQFELGYRASKLYDIDYMNDFGQYELARERLITDTQFFETFSTIFFGFGHPHVDLMPAPKSTYTGKFSTQDDEDLSYYLYCRVGQDVFANYIKCIADHQSWDGFDKPMNLVEKISGKWHTRRDF